MLSPTRIRIMWTNESATDPLRVLTSAGPLPAADRQPVPSSSPVP
jgi:hypothetical protein